MYRVPGEVSYVPERNIRQQDGGELGNNLITWVVWLELHVALTVAQAPFS